jgi:hypothetical protein
VEQAGQVVVGQADRRRDIGDRQRPGQVRLDVGERGRDGRVVPGSARFGGQLGQAPQDGPDFGGGPSRGFGRGGDGAAQRLGERGPGGAGVAHDRDGAGVAGLLESEVGVEVFGGALVAEAGLGVGWDETDAAGPDRVRGAVDDEFGVVVVQVELPEVGQAEDVVGGGEAVDADPGVHRRGRKVEMETNALHSENRQPVSDYGQLQR